MTEKQRIQNLQKALGIIRKGVADFNTAARKENNSDRTEQSREILEMVDRVINIYA